MSGWIDISVTLSDGMVHWPGDPPIRIRADHHFDHGDPCIVSRLDMGAHTGTHMDAPLHFLPGGQSLDTMPLDATVGPARVIAIQDPVSIKPEELRPHQLRPGERVLFQTRNSRREWTREPFDPDFVHISAPAAQHLADCGVRTVGIDYLSVGGHERDGVETHRLLLGAGIWIIEGLDLRGVMAGPHELVCLPLKILGSEGAPCRAILRPLPA